MKQQEDLNQLKQGLRIGEKIKYLRLIILISLLIGTTFFYIKMNNFNLIHLTQLAKLTTILYFFMICIDNFIVQGRSLYFQKMIIVIYITIVSVQVLVVLSYWTILFQFEYHKYNSILIVFNNLFNHLFVCLTLQIDNVFNLIRISRSQVILPISYVALYGIFNCYYTLNVHNIYPPIKWTDLLTYIYIIIATLFIITSHLLLVFYQNKYKYKIHNNNNNNKEQLLINDSTRD